ncbi:MAG: DUF362 domain-containing protein, partial [Planctomycetota bacterium]|nr:DUF362 domain-containing protein [Planctomycetota bacterium]
GCHILIADGLKGTDDVLVPVRGGELVKEAKIGRAVMDADIVISLTHFKCHECTGIGGTLKNLGMGCGSRAGKMDMHSTGKSLVSPDDCVGCGKCKTVCAHSAISITQGKASIDSAKCVGCGRCLGNCPMDAISPAEDDAFENLDKKIVEYAAAVVGGRPHFHISLGVDISPYCDCHSENDVPVVPDVGMFASFDPVAIDVACADAVNQAPPWPGSLLAAQAGQGSDHFSSVTPGTDWRICTNHGKKLGIGNTEYELVKI